MKFNGALVKVNDEKTIAVAVVADEFMQYPQPEKMAAMRRYATAFPGMPLILFMENKQQGISQFFGRPDLVNLMREIPLNCITWKVYETKED